MEEDYSKFDPRRYWAATNHDDIPGHLGVKLKAKMEEVVKYCWKPRTVQEMKDFMRIEQWGVRRIFDIIQHTRGLEVERSEVDGKFAYKIADHRAALEKRLPRTK